VAKSSYVWSGSAWVAIASAVPDLTLYRLIDSNTRGITDDYTLVLADADRILKADKGSNFTLTIPTNSSVAFGVGVSIPIICY